MQEYSFSPDPSIVASVLPESAPSPARYWPMASTELLADRSLTALGRLVVMGLQARGRWAADGQGDVLLVRPCTARLAEATGAQDGSIRRVLRDLKKTIRPDGYAYLHETTDATGGRLWVLTLPYASNPARRESYQKAKPKPDPVAARGARTGSNRWKDNPAALPATKAQIACLRPELAAPPAPCIAPAGSPVGRLAARAKDAAARAERRTKATDNRRAAMLHKAEQAAIELAASRDDMPLEEAAELLALAGRVRSEVMDALRAGGFDKAPPLGKSRLIRALITGAVAPAPEAPSRALGAPPPPRKAPVLGTTNRQAIRDLQAATEAAATAAAAPPPEAKPQPDLRDAQAAVLARWLNRAK